MNKAIPLPVTIALLTFLAVVLLTMLRSRKTGRSALYSLASMMHRGCELAGRVFPTAARVIEGLPDGFRAAWESESDEPRFERVRKISRAG